MDYDMNRSGPIGTGEKKIIKHFKITPDIRKCSICGKNYDFSEKITTRRRKDTCSMECSKERTKRYHREYSRKWGKERTIRKNKSREKKE